MSSSKSPSSNASSSPEKDEVAPGREVSREEEEEEEEEEPVSLEDGEAADDDDDDDKSDDDEPAAAEEDPPLPDEPTPPSPADGPPPLPQEAPPPAEDDGWDCQWDPASQAWFFHNRFTGKTQWDNPRVPPSAEPSSSSSSAPQPPPAPSASVVGGYNPAIHGDYDPNAWYAQSYETSSSSSRPDGYGPSVSDADPYAADARFNRFTGQFQSDDLGPARHSDDAKSRRQMNAFFDVDAAANAHDGRSLRAERSHQKPSKSELKAFKEKRRARKEEKRRAWLRD